MTFVFLFRGWQRCSVHGWVGRQKTFDLDWIFDHCNCWRLLAVQLPAPVNTSYRPSINYLVLGTARGTARRERQGKGGLGAALRAQGVDSSKPKPDLRAHKCHYCGICGIPVPYSVRYGK